MKAASIKQLKDELSSSTSQEVMDICLRLARFKKENKELLTYLLFEAEDEAEYIEEIKSEINEEFRQINTTSYYFIKKSIRKILRNTKKHIRYSQKKQTEIELLIYFCQKMNDHKPSIHRNKVLQAVFERQINLIRKATSKLHEDLQYDYRQEIDKLTLNR